MAEAMVVEERASVPKRFFCHMCNVEINIPNADYTCPLCSNGFVEELPPNTSDSSTASTSGTARSGSGSNLSGTSGVSSNDPLEILSGSDNGSGSGPLINVESLRNDIVSLLNMRNGQTFEIPLQPNQRHGNFVRLGGMGPSRTGTGGATSNTVTGVTAGGRVRPAHLDRLDNVLFEILQSLPLTGATAEIVTGPGGAAPSMFFMGNPGDYAWGREGLDTIVTQMLNQMETSGPPPLPAQRIEEIPNVKITNEEVDGKMQCSICWDDFKLDEMVRKLPCSHLYHEGCIVPWLNLHSTCPICRKSLAEDESSDDFVVMEDISGTNGGDSNTLPSHTSNTANPTRNTSSQSTQAGTIANNQQQEQQQQQQQSTTSQQQRNDVFTFEDDNMVLD